MINDVLILLGLVTINILLFKLMKYIIHKDGYSYYTDIFVELPGTIVHELSHLIMSIVLLSKVTAFSIIPHKDGDNVTYGYVEQIPKFKISNFFIGLAPLLLNIPILYIGLIYFGIDIKFNVIDYKSIEIENIVMMYITGIVVSSSILSSQDVKVAINGLFSISGVILGFLIGYLWTIKKEWFSLVKDIDISEYVIDLTIIMTNTIFMFLFMVIVIYIIEKVKR